MDRCEYASNGYSAEGGVVNIQSLFHDSEGVHECVSQQWTFAMDTFPVPKRELACPICSEPNIQLSNISYGVRPDSAHPYRADVSFKCTRCSFFWTHGVVITSDVYRNATGTEDEKTWRWREIRDAIKGRPND